MGHSLLDLPPDVLAQTLGLLANDLPALAACCAVSRSICHAARHNLAQLQALTLKGRAARSPALAALLPRTRSLASLDLSHCYGWLGPEACRLVASIPTLHTLKLDGCRGVTHNGLAVRLWGCTGGSWEGRACGGWRWGRGRRGAVCPGCVRSGRGGLSRDTRVTSTAEYLWAHMGVSRSLTTRNKASHVAGCSQPMRPPCPQSPLPPHGCKADMTGPVPQCINLPSRA